MTDLLDLAHENFVSLTTFRRSGEAVSTPVWIARDGNALMVTTPAGSGKVKRLRNDSRVELRPCSRMGRVADDAPTVRATAEVIDDPAAVDAMGSAFLAKYRFEYRLFLWIERRGAAGQQRRVKLRITAR